MSGRTSLALRRQPDRRRAVVTRDLVTACLILGARIAGAQATLSADAPPAVTVLRAARMLDVRNGAVISNPVIVVANGRITAAGAGVAVPPGALVTELGNVLLLPGLIDSHTHLLQNYSPGVGGDDPNMLITVATMSPARRALLGAAMGRQDLDAGITSVRDLGNSGLNGDVALRDAIAAGWVAGPRIFASTRALSAAGGQFGGLTPEAQSLLAQEYVVVSGVEEARRAVRQAFYDGADLIKVIVNTGPRVIALDELKVIVEEAHRVGKTVAAHATTDMATRIAAAAGVNSIEHAYEISDDALRTMAEKKIFLVPTDYPAEFYVSLGGALSAADRERQLAGATAFVARAKDRVARAIKLGVRVAYGSDEYYDAPGRSRGQTSLLTLQAYQDDGMSPVDVIRTATINAAELLGWGGRIGALEVGTLADIIGVGGDPLKDVRDLQQVRFVMKDGRVVRNDVGGQK